jgi:hypothetical protein
MKFTVKHAQFSSRAAAYRAWHITVAAVLLLGTLGLASALSEGPAAADSSTLFAAANATGSACSSTSPCSLATALGDVTAGGTIELVTPGTTASYDGGFTVATAGTSSTLPVTIEPANGIAPVIDGGASQTVLLVDAGVYLDISGATIQNGDSSNGGGIDNEGGAVTITGSTISDNSASTFGGGIYNNEGTVTITGSTISDNTAASSGGGIYSLVGNVTITGSNISDNTATFSGGGIFNAHGGGPFIPNPSNLTGNLTIIASTISGNTASQGGGILNQDGSTVLIAPGTPLGTPYIPNLTITGSTISGNTASTKGGGVNNSGLAYITTSTIADNTADWGGGEYNINGIAIILGSTISGNTAVLGGAVFGDASENYDDIALNLSGDILATPGGPPAGGECYGYGISDLGDNLSDDNTCPLFPSRNSVSSSSASENLGPLTNNGGPTDTIMPLAGNPAIGLIPDPTASGLLYIEWTTCPNTDQRGVPSAGGAPCNAGAVEPGLVPQTITFTSAVPTTPAIGATSLLSATGGASGNPVTFSIAADSAFVCSISSSTVTFTGAGSCVIDADQVGDTNYAAAPEVTQTFNVAQAGQAITFSGPQTGTYGGTTVLSGTGGGSGDPVTFSVDPTSGTGVCTTSGTDGSVVSYTGTGTCVIDANQVGDTNYTAAPEVTRTMTAGQGSQTISFTSTPPTDATVGGSYTVTATGGATANPVTFSATSPSCSITGSVISFTGPGSCVIDANQVGDTNYAAAPEVSQTVAAQVQSRAGATGVAVTPDGTGYWVLGPTGSLSSYGSAVNYGSMAGKLLNAPIVGMAATPDGNGYWLVGSDGGVFAFGDAAFYGSTGGTHLNQPVVGMTSTPDDKGYWLVASDGGVFAFGDAAFYGSTGGTHLSQPVVGMAATPDGKGYWLVAADGGVFSFGDAVFYGSTGGTHLNQPVVGMASTPDGKGYWLVASDGGVFAFGDAAFYGSTGGTQPAHNVVGLFPTETGTGYTLVNSQGTATTFGG